ncbi:hypothetical protein BDY21DRAFT_424332 [Lineolata rhizophorae]|uniref:Uncharacterized protein n=1 Tax=Lineolata rhizophorae TaxID=578093 RepID=A0A6A6NPB8_9PEZI|nr:hypothetical protein BDY21DRAFT_424332 [Lineolata rhizophorae]
MVMTRASSRVRRSVKRRSASAALRETEEASGKRGVRSAAGHEEKAASGAVERGAQMAGDEAAVRQQRSWSRGKPLAGGSGRAGGGVVGGGKLPGLGMRHMRRGSKGDGGRGRASEPRRGWAGGRLMRRRRQTLASGHPPLGQGRVGWLKAGLGPSMGGGTGGQGRAAPGRPRSGPALATQYPPELRRSMYLCTYRYMPGHFPSTPSFFLEYVLPMYLGTHTHARANADRLVSSFPGPPRDGPVAQGWPHEKRLSVVEFL